MKENARLLNNAQHNLVRALGDILETEGHVDLRSCSLVADLSVRMGRYFGLSQDRLTLLETAVRLRDIGKMGVPESIMQKNGPLTDEEWAVVRSHPELGQGLIRSVAFLHPIAKIVAAHHERYDGKGYPKGLRGTAIPIEARICSVADAYHSMVIDRPYRKALPTTHARKEVIRNSGTQFDPDVVHTFIAVERDLSHHSCQPEAGSGVRRKAAAPVSRGSARSFSSALAPDQR
ncbi:MAG: HD domain-containing phosphohydrolase [Dehalococcoidia bacterium]|nr:HD domain-containing phosphohydrolase [Dehalococcoidia bacterium]